MHLSTSLNSPATVFFVGLDVGKSECWAAPQTGPRRKFALDPASVAALAAWLRNLAPPAGTCIRCVLEHTGVYSQAWAALLEAQGLECALLNPWRVKQFALSCGLRSKTDRADSAAILAAALHFKPAARRPPVPVQTTLALLVAQRRSLQKDCAGLKSRLHALSFVPDAPPELEHTLRCLLQNCSAAVSSVTAQIAATIAADERLSVVYANLRSVPGFGPRTAEQLLVCLEQLQSYSAAELTAFAGLAPQHKQSGTSVHGKSRIDKQGHSALRCSLYMAALSAGTHCPQLAAFKQHLRQQGKPAKLALTAVARKLLLIARAVVRSGQPFVPQEQYA